MQKTLTLCKFVIALLDFALAKYLLIGLLRQEAEELLSLKGMTEFNFHLTLVMLWGTATVVHLPSVLVWAHNFK